MKEAVIEECSVSYVIESNKVYTTPENNGEITFKILVDTWCFENGEHTDFTDTLTLKAVKGMTWGEFIDSAYNTLNFIYRYDSVLFDYQNKDSDHAVSYFLYYDKSNRVELDDIIMPNYEYTSHQLEA